MDKAQVKDLFVLTIAAFGLAYVIGHSKITLPLRAWIDPGMPISSLWRAFRMFVVTLLECPACLGFWIGVFFALYSGFDLRTILVVGFYVAATNFIIGRMTGLIEEIK